MFSKYSDKTRISFRASGSKKALHDLAQEIHGISTVCVAMDLDFDDLFSTRIEARNVI